MSHRLAGMGVKGYSVDDPFKVVCSPDKLNEPYKVKKPSRIGVSFMGDLFHEDVSSEIIYDVFETMRVANHHTYLLLTKRPAELLNIWKPHYLSIHPFPDNAWLGVTVENQRTANERIPILLDIPAVVRYLSIEPMLENISLWEWFPKGSCGKPEYTKDMTWELNKDYENGISWVIFGAESGPGKRPCKLEWIRNGVGQCKEAGVPVFVKQLNINGKIVHDINQFPEDLRIQEYPERKEVE